MGTIKGLVSVIIPLYGSFDIRRVLAATESLKIQKGVDLEVIIAEQNMFPTLNERRLPKGVKYVFKKINQFNQNHFFAPGAVRNAAAREARGEFLYNSDGDIIFLCDRYMKYLLSMMTTSGKRAFYRPPMRRLPIEGFETFIRKVNAKGLREALSSLDCSHPFVAGIGGPSTLIKAFKKKESRRKKIFLYTEADHATYLSDPAFRGEEPRFSTLALHAGGTFMRRKDFDIVGGYCEKFVGWGCHDADIQWKLAQFCDLIQVPTEQRFEVLHMDHPRDTFSREKWLQNRALQVSRRKRGVADCCMEDTRILNEGCCEKSLRK